MTQRKILLTTALIYANGQLHLGHLVENIRADIFKRFQQLNGHDCLFVGGSDCHGTPIMLNAEKQGITPETLINASREAQMADLAEFGISFDNFYLSHSEENKTLSSEFFLALESAGFIEKRVIKQAFDPEKAMFLPDRFIKGECPKCHALDQYGDGCEACGATYSPVELKNPTSVVSNATPIEKESEHLFFKLQDLEKPLQRWLSENHVPEQIANKLKEWFGTGLKAWDISRDAPYFGFEIPGHPGKYFYVWLDAPIGYLASLENFCKTHPDYKLGDYWNKDSKAEVHHFIGKDIVYFHGLFWPAILMAADKRTPSKINVNGFLTVNGEKLSKSRGNFINARTYLEALAPCYLRYYLAAKLNNHIEDIDLNFEDFRLRVNADLVGKYVNIASRCAGFITKHFDGQLANHFDDASLVESFVKQSTEIATDFDALATSQAIRKIMELADQANQYIAEKAPWKRIKEENQKAHVQQICTTALNLFRILSLYLKPIIPDTVAKVEDFLNIKPMTWADVNAPLLNHTINPFKPLLQRVEQSQLDTLCP